MILIGLKDVKPAFFLIQSDEKYVVVSVRRIRTLEEEMITPLEMARLAIRYCITKIGFADVSKIVSEEDPAHKERLPESFNIDDYRNKKGRE